MSKQVLLGTTISGQPVATLTKSLTTHTTIVGTTGSGKTGVVMGIVEELVRNEIPTVILDIKGDMSNIFQQTDPALEAMIHPRIITPGALHGEPVNISAGLADPNRISTSVTALLALVGLNGDPIKSKPHAFISAILRNRHDKRQRCNLIDLILAIQEPPFKRIGAMDLDEVMGKSARKVLASQVNNLLVAHDLAPWREGTGLDMHKLTTAPTATKTPVVVYTIAHIANEDARDFAISLLFDEMVSYMRTSQGSGELKVAFVVDECFGLMPPKGSSDTKTALLTLLKQGRASGIGVILATQNPMDLDYKGMSNCNTWIIGKLQTANDRKRLVEGVCNAVPGLDKKTLEEKIGGLGPRQFLLAKGNTLVPFLSRNTSCQLTGPMDANAIKGIVQVAQQEYSITNKIRQLFK
jgi:type IV secretory pathway VirB4 component